MAGSLARLERLLGSWQGRETGAAGTGIAHRTYRLRFDRFIEAQHQSVFEPPGSEPDGETHEELLLFSAEGGDIVAREFHSDGMVISYVLSSASDEHLVFQMTGLANGPPGVTGRLTLSMDGTDRFTEVLELGPDAGSLREFIRIDWERSGGEQAV